MKIRLTSEFCKFSCYIEKESEFPHDSRFYRKIEKCTINSKSNLIK
ncbi:hypothetical protein LEP1GSC082_1782 [Leptospira kirschneri str. H2]|uniref:Uncharacterized protein n=1 Tax=Leptospira kirschneri serovar Bulgarica str. Nikolaevo TaxID=1240687 RepID=M6FNB3_9LEPT|nr:hypothetical protein LEP1GSC082_1782 [Leptospira kirschneri str. H2]EMK24251.1 hypothetical protein LEP1GSC008_3658 [Leptospira kirschneri serovar Bulgarica str. Nikolaevo]